jgi:aminoglycoside 3-N-acetyltransferase
VTSPAEHLASIPNKRLRRYEVPLAAPVGIEGRMIKKFDTSVPRVPVSCCDLFGSAPLLMSSQDPPLGALL